MSLAGNGARSWALLFFPGEASEEGSHDPKARGTTHRRAAHGGLRHGCLGSSVWSGICGAPAGRRHAPKQWLDARKQQHRARRQQRAGEAEDAVGRANSVRVPSPLREWCVADMVDDADGRREGAELQTVARVLADTVPPLVERLSRVRSGKIYRQALEVLERPLLAHVLAMTGGNQLRAARLLGINRNTLRKRCRELRLPLPKDPPAAAEKAPSAALAPSAARSAY